MIRWMKRKLRRKAEVVTLPVIEGSFWTDDEQRSAERMVEALLLTRRIMALQNIPDYCCGDDWPE